MSINILNNYKYDIGLPFFLAVFCMIFGVLIGAVFGEIVFDEIDIITVASVVLFIFTTFFACANDKNFSLAIPFVFVAFPTAVNNIFPGVYLENEKMGVIYPLFCHTEVFLLFTILAKKGFRNLKADRLAFLLCLSFMFTSVVNIVFYMNTHYTVLLIAGQYPARILMLTVIALQTKKLDIDRFMLGLCLAILFLSLESTVYTKVSGAPTWTSGSLAGNTFGNVMGQMSMVLFFYLIQKTVKGLRRCMMLFAVLLGIVLTVLTETRMAMLAMLIVASVLIYPRMSKKVKFFSFLFVFFIVGYVLKNDVISGLSGKMDIKSAMEAIDFTRSSGLEIQYSEVTTSIITRLNLWGVSLDMFGDKPLTGIGWNLFNVLKYMYGFEYDVIIDPHNGYLSFICQLGIWGFFWIYFLYYRSWKLFLKSNDDRLKTISIFNVGMSICELTNAGSYKFGVLSLLLFISVYINNAYLQTKGYVRNNIAN